MIVTGKEDGYGESPEEKKERRGERCHEDQLRFLLFGADLAQCDGVGSGHNGQHSHVQVE